MSPLCSIILQHNIHNRKTTPSFPLLAHKSSLVGVVLVVPYKLLALCLLPVSTAKHTQVEVVVLSIADGEQETNNMCDGCEILSVFLSYNRIDSKSKYPHEQLKGSCQSTSSGTIRGSPLIEAREQHHGAACRRTGQPFACGQHHR